MNNQSRKTSRKPWIFFIIWIIFLWLVVSQFSYVLSLGGMRAARILHIIYLVLVIWSCVRFVKPKENKYLLFWAIAALLLMFILYGPIRRNFLETLPWDKIHDVNSVQRP